MSAALIDNQSVNALASLFSDSSKEKFSRLIKPEEFQQTSKVVELNDKKKRKRKNNVIDKELEQPAPIESRDTEYEESSESASTEARTAFVGNLPLSESMKTVKNLLQEFGEIESVRLRSVPIAGTAVDECGNQDLVRKVCVNSRKFGEQKGSFNAYVVFKDPASVTKALSVNNKIVGDRHVRVDRAAPTLFDPQRSVFIGSLPHYTDEEELRKHFSEALTNGQDDIESVRIIRDPTTLIGKGVGYILFKSRDSVFQALTLHEKKFKKRELRVKICGKRTKRTVSRDSMNKDSKSRDGDDKEYAKKRKLTDIINHKKNSKSKDEDDVEKSVDNAIRRIKLKSTVTRNKVLIEKGQKKAQPGRKGKRLGGVVKRAMKAANSGKKG